jgi:hypothetical protein
MALLSTKEKILGHQPSILLPSKVGRMWLDSSLKEARMLPSPTFCFVMTPKKDSRLFRACTSNDTHIPNHLCEDEYHNSEGHSDLDCVASFEHLPHPIYNLLATFLTVYHVRRDLSTSQKKKKNCPTYNLLLRSVFFLTLERGTFLKAQGNGTTKDKRAFSNNANRLYVLCWSVNSK